MAHADARTTVYARKLIVSRVAAGHRPCRVARQLGVSRETVYKWVRRWRAEGDAGLADHSSRPHCMPRQTPPARPSRSSPPATPTTPGHGGWRRSWESLPPRSGR
ncbi:leucine zipper domain-containing protein [Modestobacter sp. Leaf380]|uniref:helix-turn-helix domain-containing protein n=1 Tax=Modestobacter sp. Leaf380 TaxID=1736356 RepID=UPI0009E8F04C